VTTLGNALARLARAGRPAAAPPRERAAEALAQLSALSEFLAASRDVTNMAAEVTATAERLLEAGGAALLLASDDQQGFDILGASGSLAGQEGRRVHPSVGGLALDALGGDGARIGPVGPCRVFGDATVRNAVAVPLLAHGVTAGALVVADRREGSFDTDDGVLLSAIAVHGAGALANARFYEMVVRAKEQWEATFDALSHGVALVGADATVIRANAAFGAVVGASVPAVVGQHVGQALFGERHGLADLLDAARSGRRPPPLVRRSDSLRRVLRVSATATNATAESAALVVAVEDVTDQQALEAQAIQNEKMAAVGTLVSGVAHELNNPLTSIAGLAEFLLEQPEDAAPDRNHLRVIAEEAQRAGSIVRNLLTFARKGTTAQPEAVDLSDVVERTLFLMGWELKLQSIAIEKKLAPELPAVRGDRQQLQQVILNLMSNAAQAVTGLPPGLPRRISVSTTAEGDRVVVRVTDTGLGIPGDVLPQIFSPFFTTKRQGEGTGLGLFISYGIVTGHGGTLSAESRPGAGATFTVSLPCARPAETATPADGTGDVAPAPARRRRILVVDDDPGVRRMVSALFVSEGHAVDTAGDGDSGIVLARGGDYDLVIADHRAAAGGVPFLLALEALRPGWQARCIVSTVDPQLAAAGGERAACVLRKPFDLRGLRAAAGTAWASAPAP
jgi:two-component system, NtrC family, sensor kinase